MKTITLIPVAGQKVTLSKDDLSTMQAAVGGLVEVIRHIPAGGVLLVNEEGLMTGLPYNPEASRLAGQPVVGPAVHIKGGRSW